jgi:hypothetical protein
MSSETERDPPLSLLGRDPAALITRREAIWRVSALLGGVALVGQSALLAGCRDDGQAGIAEGAEFSEADVALLSEVAETILPETSTPGAKAAGVGPFIALIVKDTYDPDEQRIFREGMRKLEEASERMHGVSFMEATPQQRLALLEELDREQYRHMRAREEAQNARTAGLGADPDDEEVHSGEAADAYVPDQRQENTPGADVSGAVAITEASPVHYFRMMKELALLGYFTSEIGYNQAMRYVETPGRFDPCVPYSPGEKAWAPHA